MTNDKNNFFESKNFVEAVIEQIPERIYWKDEEGIYRGCNTTFAKSRGYISPVEIVGKTEEELFAGTVSTDSLSANKNKMRKMVGAEKQLDRISDDVNIPSFHKIILYDDQKNRRGELGISLDTPSLAQAKQAIQDQVSKTERVYRSNAEFLSVASHEIRGPVANIVTCLQLLTFELNEYISMVNNLRCTFSANSKDGNSQLLDNLNHIPDQITDIIVKTSLEASRALKALGHLDELYRLKLDGVQSECVTLEIQAFIKKTIESLLEDNPNHITIHINMDDFTYLLLIDSRNLRDVIKIVVRNAMRFSKKGGEVFIDVVPVMKKNKRFVSISIRDKGCGISKEQMSGLFTTFLDNEIQEFNTRYRKPSFQLPIAEMKMKAMGGEISIDSKLGIGTVVNLLCPYEISSLTSTKPTLLTSFQTYSTVIDSTMPLKFLLVEDDPITLDIEKNQLRELGYNTDVATNSREALQLASQQHYDVIWMDITLPDMSGIDTMEKIKNYSKNPIDFIAVTSHASEQDEDYFISQGMTTVLVKPTTIDRFKECINRIIAGRLETSEN